MLSLLIPVVALAMATPSSGQEVDIHQAVAYIEEHVELPTGALPLKAYTRIYAMDPDDLRIEGEYTSGLLPMAPGVYIVTYDQLPDILDGTCADSVRVSYSPSASDIFVSCKGHTPPPPSQERQ